MTELKIHGYYQWSNTCGYGVIISDSGDEAKLVLDDQSTTDWLEIEYIFNEDTAEFDPIIDHTGYNVPLNEVMRAYQDYRVYKYIFKYKKNKGYEKKLHTTT